MRPIVQTAAGLFLAAALAVASPVAAQPAGLHLAMIEEPPAATSPTTADAFYQVMLDTAEDEAMLRSTIRSFATLPPANEAILIDHLKTILSLRAYSDYLFERLGDQITANNGDAFAAGLMQGMEAIGAGIVRLSPSQQAQFIDFSKFTIEVAAENSPEECAAVLFAGTPDPTALAAFDFMAYAAMNTKAMSSILALYREALAAELEDRAPATPTTPSQVAAGAAALQEAFATIAATSPTWQRIGAAGDLADVDPADLCLAANSVFDALDLLGEPQRAWAMQAILTEQF